MVLADDLRSAQRATVDAADALARALRICEGLLHGSSEGERYAKAEAGRFVADYGPEPQGGDALAAISAPRQIQGPNTDAREGR